MFLTTTTRKQRKEENALDVLCPEDGKKAISETTRQKEADLVTDKRKTSCEGLWGQLFSTVELLQIKCAEVRSMGEI